LRDYGWFSRRRFCRCFFCRAFGFFLRFRVGFALQLLAHLYRNFDGNRAGVGLLFRYAKSRQKVNDSLSLDLEFTGEFVNSYLGCVNHAA
jgi:hypothetical protein